ncbi:hypothetical protein Sulac_1233 [Sulfobacillus acidophilus DSM 10332]|uniref:Uncharacterized protein n=1 Tax=Sulfobacillus acidophilus (strain ATCC 700253 / DSM 10332 / NAL) TaxID=679936 RepID=G8TV93_SULAD|nr:hypothetical protein Sulac_1233 [Sulfobacillus acidophilus DSM 10332]
MASQQIWVRWDLPNVAPPPAAYQPMIVAWIFGGVGYLFGVTEVPVGPWRALWIVGITGVAVWGWALMWRRTTEPALWDGHRVIGQQSGVSAVVAGWVPAVPGGRWGGIIGKGFVQGLFGGWVIAAAHLPGSIGHGFTTVYAAPMALWRRDALALGLGLVIPGAFMMPWNTPYRAYDDQYNLIAMGWFAKPPQLP